MFNRTTTDLRAVLASIQRHAVAAGRDRITARDMAAALSVPTGNTATLWTTPGAEAPAVDGPNLKFDGAARKALERMLQVALRHRAPHIGTEHLLAALVHHGPADVVAELAERGATAEAVDDLLARLDGGPGVERLAAEPTPAEERKWQRLTGQLPKGFPYVTVLLVVAGIAVLFVLCVWGP